VVDVARSKPHLVVENLLLRQHRVVRNRSVKRPRFRRVDRMRFVRFVSRLHSWEDGLLSVKPETVLRWHRQGFQYVKGHSEIDTSANHLPASSETRH
jgi:hypothetical protein